jgi:hypothetical protein
MIVVYDCHLEQFDSGTQHTGHESLVIVIRANQGRWSLNDERRHKLVSYGCRLRRAVTLRAVRLKHLPAHVKPSSWGSRHNTRDSGLHEPCHSITATACRTLSPFSLFLYRHAFPLPSFVKFLNFPCEKISGMLSLYSTTSCNGHMLREDVNWDHTGCALNGYVQPRDQLRRDY